MFRTLPRTPRARGGVGQLAFAAALWEQCLARPLPERNATDRAVAEAQVALGEEAWTAAFTTGRALAMEQAIAYALE